MMINSEDKLIFLDIDGVLNSERWMKRQFDRLGRPAMFGDENNHEHFDPVAVARLNKIIEATGAKIVLSSSWRLLYSIEIMRELFTKVGIVGKLIDQTPDAWKIDKFIKMHADGIKIQRGFEISQWIKDNNFTGKFVVLDDSSDMATVRDHFINTDWNFGIQNKHVEEAIRRLNEVLPTSSN